jgi:hypothetical protein
VVAKANGAATVGEVVLEEVPGCIFEAEALAEGTCVAGRAQHDTEINRHVMKHARRQREVALVVRTASDVVIS